MRLRFPEISRNWLIPALGILAIILVLGFSSEGKAFFKRMSVYFENSSNPSLSSSPRNFWLPSGKETYQVVQAAGADPRIHEATIDPPDVHVGDMQKLSIVVSSEYDIESVIAKIETDNGIKELPLKFVKKVSWSELQPVKYAINSESELVILPDTQESGLASILDSKFYILNSNVAEAHSPDDWDKLLYEASWKVKDTHDAKYHTTFIVKNVKGQENSITLAWSDACSIPRSGNWNLATSFGTNCTISAEDGVEIGTSTIQTYTLTLNSKFAFNPGYGISIVSGAIAIGTGGEIKETYVWERDLDVDSYAWGSYLTGNTSPGIGWYRRSGFPNNSPVDCDDNSGSVWQNVSVGTDTNKNGYAEGSYPYINCVGSSENYEGRIYYYANSPAAGFWYIDAAYILGGE